MKVIEMLSWQKSSCLFLHKEPCWDNNILLRHGRVCLGSNESWKYAPAYINSMLWNAFLLLSYNEEFDYLKFKIIFHIKRSSDKIWVLIQIKVIYKCLDWFLNFYLCNDIGYLHMWVFECTCLHDRNRYFPSFYICHAIFSTAIYLMFNM